MHATFSEVSSLDRSTDEVISVMHKLLTFVAMAMAVSSVGAVAQSPAAGGATFKQRCLMCHTITPGAKGAAGPNLSGVGNRTAAGTAFAYSAALKQSKVKWTAANLDKFLAAPSKMVPGTRMFVGIPDSKKRAEVVAYLLSLKE